jgi:hypothetical protein
VGYVIDIYIPLLLLNNTSLLLDGLILYSGLRGARERWRLLHDEAQLVREEREVCSQELLTSAYIFTDGSIPISIEI